MMHRGPLLVGSSFVASLSWAAVQEADSEALKTMEDTAAGVTERVRQLAADRAELAQSRAQTRSDLSAAQQSLAAKKAALDQAADSNRRNGCAAL